MKKVLIMMMCVIMVVCFMPTVAMAEGEDTIMLEASLNGTNVQQYTVAQLNGFFSDLQNATTADVKLLNNISLANGTYIEIKDGQTVTLDFNGCTIIKNDSSSYAPIENYGIMILRDASEIGKGGISGVNRCVNNYGKMTIKNGYFTTSSNQGGTAVQNKIETAVMTIEDCVVNAGTFGFSNAGIATINGGIFENYVSCSQCNPTGWAYTAKSTGKLYVYGGEIHGVQGL